MSKVYKQNNFESIVRKSVNESVDESLIGTVGKFLTHTGGNMGKFSARATEKGLGTAVKDSAHYMQKKLPEVYRSLKGSWGTILKDMEQNGCKGSISKYQKLLEKRIAEGGPNAEAAKKILGQIKTAKQAGLLTVGAGGTLVLGKKNKINKDETGEEYTDNGEYGDETGGYENGGNDDDMLANAYTGANGGFSGQYSPEMFQQMFQNIPGMNMMVNPTQMMNMFTSMPRMVAEEIDGDFVAGMKDTIEGDEDAKEAIQEIFDDPEYLKYLLSRILENGSPVIKMVKNAPEIVEKIKNGDLLGIIRDFREDYEDNRKHQTEVIIEMIKDDPKCAIIMVKAIAEALSGVGAPLAMEDLTYLAVEYIKAENKISKEEYNDMETKEQIQEGFYKFLNRMNHDTYILSEQEEMMDSEEELDLDNCSDEELEEFAKEKF